MTRDATRDQAILHARTAAFARPRVAESTALELALLLRVAGERFAVVAEAVRAVLAIRKLTTLPNAPPHVAGLLVRGGNILPAFHLHAVLGLPLVALPEHGRGLILGVDGGEVVLLVEHVDVETSIDPATLRDAPATVAPALRRLLRGTTPDGIALLDHEALLESPLLLVNIPLPR